jgi:hypothetical protein
MFCPRGHDKESNDSPDNVWRLSYGACGFGEEV